MRGTIEDIKKGGARDAIPIENTSIGGAPSGGNPFRSAPSGRNPIRGAHQPLPGSFKDNKTIPAGGGPSDTGTASGTGIKDKVDIETPIIQVGAP